MAERLYHFGGPDEPDEGYDNRDYREPDPIEIYGMIPEVAAFYGFNTGIEYFIEAWENGVAESRREKGLPEKRRTIVEWARDKKTIWTAKKGLKAVDTPEMLLKRFNKPGPDNR